MNQERGKYLLRNTLIFALGNFGTKAINFFLVPLYTGVLLTEEYGTVDLVYTVAVVLMPLLTLNFAEAVMRYSLDKDADHELIMSAGIKALLLCTILSAALLPLLRFYVALSMYGVYVWLYVVSLAASQLFLCNLRGRELLLRYSIGNILHAFSIAGLNILFLVVLKKGVAGYLLAYILANAITAGYAAAVGDVKFSLRRSVLRNEKVREMAWYSFVLIPTSFAWWIMNSSDRIMVSAMVGVAANGIYAVAYKVPTMLSTLATVFNTAWSYSAIKEDESADKVQYSNMAYTRLVATVCLVASGLLLVMKPFLRVYVAPEYYGAWQYTPPLIVGFVFMTLGTFVATSYTVHKDSAGYLKSGLAGAVINVVLNFCFIPRMGALGAAIATCASYIAVYLFRLYDTRKYIPIHAAQAKHFVSYGLLLASAFFMYQETRVCAIGLSASFLCMLALHADYLRAVLNAVKAVLSRRNHNEDRV